MVSQYVIFVEWQFRSYVRICSVGRHAGANTWGENNTYVSKLGRGGQLINKIGARYIEMIATLFY